MHRADVLLKFIQSLKIRSRDLRLIPLALNDPQKALFKRIEDAINRRKKVWAIVLKARREGVSTLIEALMLSRVLLNDYVHALVMASKDGNTAEIWRMASTMVENSPWAKYAKKVDKELHFGRSKLIVATAGTPDATRGFDLSCLHLSEVAFWQNHETMLAALQCLPDSLDSYCFIESTANGKVGDGELFYNTWCAAEAGENEFIPIFLPWYEMPEYAREGWFYPSDLQRGHPMRAKAIAARAQGIQPFVLTDLSDEEQALRDEYKLSAAQLSWRRWAIANKCQGNIDQFNQEYPASANQAFIQSGLPMFRSHQLAPFQATCFKGLRYRVDRGALVKDPQGYIEVWREPEPGHTYVIGADTSMGFDDQTGRAQRSRSAACILDMETLEQVAEYDAASPPHVQAKHLAAMGRRYNNALLAPEVTSSGGGGGRELIVYLKEAGYWNLHVWRQADRIRREAGNLYGWETNARTRPMMIARIREVIEERSCVLHSTKLIAQLADFGESDEQRTEALTGRDDLLFAFGIALCSRRENYFPMPITKIEEANPFNPAKYGFAVQSYDVADAVTRHWANIRKKTPLLEDKSYMEL